jgi:group I intron endonuclease
MIGYVYIATSRTSGKTYVGITVRCAEKRWSEHVANAQRGRPSRAIERAIAKYGAADFDISILERCISRHDLVAAEIKWIAATESFGPTGYNMTKGGDGQAGAIVSAETRAKQSATRTGRKLTAEHRKNVGLGHLGLKKSDATRAKLSASLMGRIMSPESIRKMIISKTGSKLPEAAKAAISRPVIIDGVQYRGVGAAAAALGIQVSTINHRIERGEPGYVALKPLVRRPKKSQAEVEMMRLRNAKAVVVDGNSYPSITAAAVALGITRPGVAYRIKIARQNYGLV